MSKLGIQLIADERTRQLQKWSPEHDAEHDDGEVIVGTELPCIGREISTAVDVCTRVQNCKLCGAYSKLDPIRCLTIAGALLAAELDRLLGTKCCD